MGIEKTVERFLQSHAEHAGDINDAVWQGYLDSRAKAADTFHLEKALAARKTHQPSAEAVREGYHHALREPEERMPESVFWPGVLSLHQMTQVPPELSQEEVDRGYGGIASDSPAYTFLNGMITDLEGKDTLWKSLLDFQSITQKTPTGRAERRVHTFMLFHEVAEEIAQIKNPRDTASYQKHPSTEFAEAVKRFGRPSQTALEYVVDSFFKVMQNDADWGISEKEWADLVIQVQELSGREVPLEKRAELYRFLLQNSNDEKKARYVGERLGIPVEEKGRVVRGVYEQYFRSLGSGYLLDGKINTIVWATGIPVPEETFLRHRKHFLLENRGRFIEMHKIPGSPSGLRGVEDVDVQGVYAEMGKTVTPYALDNMYAVSDILGVPPSQEVLRDIGERMLAAFEEGNLYFSPEKIRAIEERWGALSSDSGFRAYIDKGEEALFAEILKKE